MRRLLVIVAASLFLSQYAAAQFGPSTPPLALPGVECFEHMEAPEYPKAALQGRVDGSIWTKIDVTAQGTAGKVDMQVVTAWTDGGKLLTPPVEKAIQASKFKPDCGGKTVSIVYRFALHGDATANPKPESRTEPPHLVWIESQPETAAAK